MLNTKEKFVWDVIDGNGGLDAVDTSVDALIEYMETEYSYDSKNNRLDALAAVTTMTVLYEWVVSVFTATLIHRELTYQAMCGILHHKVNLPVVLDQVKTMAEIVAVISKSGLVHINRQGSGKPILVTPGFNLGVEIPAPDKHQILLEQPKHIKSNWYNGSLLLGNPMNHHNENICLDHINRMNAIAVSLNAEFISLYAETPKKPRETQEQLIQWEQFVDDSFDKYADFIAAGNKGFLDYAYDTRGRSYDTGYYITSQGSSYKKAILELANQEIVEG